MAGTVNVSRDLWDDPTFKDSEMSQREAWIWMIAEASWKARVKRFGSVEVELQRGQLAASSRFMAKAWMWSEPRVRRYLDMLENRRMITRVTDAGVTVITISKYNDYQNGPRVTDAPATQEPTQDRRTSDANYNKGEIRDKIHGGRERAQGAEIQTIRERILVAVGADPVTGLTGPNGNVLGTRHDMEEVSRWQALGLSDDRILAVITEAIAKKRDGPPSSFSYFEKPMCREAGRKAKPPLTPIEGSANDRPTARDRRSAASDDSFVRVVNAAAGTGRTS